MLSSHECATPRGPRGPETDPLRERPWNLGVDLGSTTAKAVLLSPDGALAGSAYRRHEARIGAALQAVVAEAAAAAGARRVRVLFTGSAGMGVAERAGLPFIQEVHAACALAAARFPDTRTLLDVGGEDCKLVFFEADGRIDARMNSGCAGGTGAFLDQMAALLSVGPAAFEALAAAGSRVFPVASRCGVFAKTDVHNLLSTGVARSDVALSIYDALATQVLSALARGRRPCGPLLLTGGPLSFLPTLGRVFRTKLELQPEALRLPARGELACAEGAALQAEAQGAPVALADLGAILQRAGSAVALSAGEPPLFADAQARAEWTARRFVVVPRVAPEEATGELFLGIDSGSTTTKLVLSDAQGRLVASHYEMNGGEALEALGRGLDALRRTMAGRAPVIRAAAVTGYGEDLVKAALGIELGLVETSAHLRAARALAPDVSFVLDIGGQDMKAIFVRAGQVQRVEVNEACSSGCGSFLQAFAETLSMPMGELAEAACRARAPRSLGSRCTVFMNSMVKQALREGGAIDDIAAGLCYSVIRNCLQKVLKLSDPALLGERVVLQGGTFLNPAVQRAFELLTGRPALCPDSAGLAGAWGAALWARDQAAEGLPERAGRPLEAFAVPALLGQRSLRCGACANHCPVTVLEFQGGARHWSGNRCERAFHNGSRTRERGVNHLAAELQLLLDRPLLPAAPPRAGGGKRVGLRVGLPMALGLWEHLPFWTALLTGLGHEVVLSGPTDAPMVDQAIDTCCSDSVCLPARIASAHLVRLGRAGVDRILFPQVVFEASQEGSRKGYNCPIVTGYPEVAASAVASARPDGVPVATPPVSFRDEAAMRRSARRALRAAGIDLRGFPAAFRAALEAFRGFQRERREIGRRALARTGGRGLVLLACRPYHLDPYLHHGVPEMLADLGYDVLSCQCLPEAEGSMEGAQVLTQWAFPNRVLQAAHWAAANPRVQLVQLNSFGCGPDAVVADEAADMLAAQGRPFTLLRVDAATAPGSIRLRLRTLEMSLQAARERGPRPRRSTPPFLEADRRRTLLTVPLDPLISRVLAGEFARLGYRLEVLPATDRASQEAGLRHVNNEICYPAILSIGDILKALGSGRYPLDAVAVLLTQTGGPCRASNYVPLLKKAMVSAGFGTVPVVALHTAAGQALNDQPGFRPGPLSLLRAGLQSIAVTDALSMMARALAPRERQAGSAMALAEHLAGQWAAQTRRGFGAALDFVARACAEMAALPAEPRAVTRVGIVGEIYVKHSAYANRHLAEWLVAQGLEPVLPPLMNFFVQEPVNVLANHRAGVETGWLAPGLAGLADAGIEAFLEALNRRLEPFPYPLHFPLPRALAALAGRVMALTHQYGEGWPLGAEILDMAARGVRHIVCLQPFGCIANQVVARGIESRLKAEYPELSLAFLDLDHNTSEANLFNRMQLLIAPAARRPCPAPVG